MTLYIRHFFSALLMCVVILSAQTIAYAGQFFETLYDVPVLLDLKEIQEEAVAFDKPSGRIAHAGAYSFKSHKAIIAAYSAALTQMGWANMKEGEFRREGEVLSILVIKSDSSPDSGVLVNFSLKPMEE